MRSTVSDQKALIAYITARIELDFDAERQAISHTGVDDATAQSWQWVRSGRARREALKQLLKVLNEKCGGGARPALLWLAASWGEDPPLTDLRGLPYTVNGGGLVYLTECCLSTATYSGSVLTCRACYQELDMVMVMTPDPSTTDTLWRPDPEAQAQR
jgi:hypothetical protein